ncbi:hypothetical protein SAMN04489764_2663 [Thermostaphylospora chromogena]|uniref:Uncharacterized protein n=1 Tax=Thermostaphylospora chromogena TaxID=35622 RepID=A0A1H1EWF1_9ACTN|nr:hypothetical protein SAMN04489764_2663 [Thermostaphylospora chromogena]
MAVGRGIRDFVKRFRRNRLEAALRAELTPADMRALDALTKEKQLAVVGMLSAYLQVRQGVEEAEVMRMVAEFIPDLHDSRGMAPGAVHNAYTTVIFHLLDELAAARHEPVEQTWQRVAAELTRRASSP